MAVATALPLVALAGNPNAGKSALFNRLTGGRARVANYPGLTVEREEGRVNLPVAGELRLLDVPGTYSLAARSKDERIALLAVAGLPPLELPDAVIVVVDGTQLGRHLYLALQIIELDLPVIVAVNFADDLAKEGMELHRAELERHLGVPVVAVSALSGQGMDDLKRLVERVLADPERARPGPRWVAQDPTLLGWIDEVGRSVPEAWHRHNERRRRALALWALLSLEPEDELHDVPADLRLAALSVHAAAKAAGRAVDDEIVRGRYDWIDQRADRFVRQRGQPRTSRSDQADRWLLHPALGFAIFASLMVVVFQSLFTWADPMIAAIEVSFAWIGGQVRDLLPAGLLTDLLVDGVIAGVGGVLVFLPQILLLFFFIGLMEDTGYMARIAFIMDRLMRSVGLHGRAFVPMLSAYACAVPAVLSTRTMERQRDRFLTMMVLPLMTCSARLPVYGLLIAAFAAPTSSGGLTQGLLLVGMYVFGTTVALLAAAVLGRTVLKGKRVPLLLQMPPYRRPHLATVWRRMVVRSGIFVKQAGTVILLCSIGMWALLTFPRAEPAAELAASIEEIAQEIALRPTPQLELRLAELESAAAGQQLRDSYAGRFGQLLEPVIAPLGFDWKIGVGLVGAFAAREVFISTMAVVYNVEADADEESVTLRERIREASWPDGRRVFTPLVCLSLMVFFALACQCMSTLAAVKRETNSWRWPAFLFAYNGVLAWVASFAVYQGGRLLGFE